MSFRREKIQIKGESVSDERYRLSSLTFLQIIPIEQGNVSGYAGV